MLVDGAELLDDAGRNRSLAAGRIIFWREQDAVNQIGRLLTEQSGGAAAVRQFVQYVSKDPSLHDADKLDKIGATGIARRVSTDTSSHYLIVAMRKLRSDLQNFPDMHFPTSKRLASAKKEFTKDFLLANN